MSKVNSVIHKEAPPPGHLGKPELYSIALGYVIGAGIVALPGVAIAMTGYSAWLGFFIAILFGLLINVPAIFVTSAVRLGGGPYSMLAGLSGKTMAGMWAFAFLTQQITIGAFGIALGMYANALWPSVSPQLVGILAITVFYIINLFGIDVMVKVQKLMAWILLGAFIMFIIIGITRLNNPVLDVSTPEFFSHGSQGFIASIFLFVGSTNGYLMTMSYGRHAKKATRDIPWAMLMCIPTFIIIYCGVTIVAAGVLPLETVAGKPLVLVAKAIMNPAVFVIFMVAGPFMALTTTINSFLGNNTLPFAQACKDGWMPRSFAQQNKYGAYYIILTAIYLIGLIPLIVNYNIMQVTMNVYMFLAGLSIMYAYAYLQLPKRYPEAWRKSRLHIPDQLYYGIVIVATLGWIAVFIKSFTSIPRTGALVSVGIFAALLVIGAIRGKNKSIVVETSIWEDE